VWAHLLVHYAIRALMHQAALQAEVDTDRLSFTRSLHIARRQVTRPPDQAVVIVACIARGP